MVKIFSDGGARGNPGSAASAFAVYEGSRLIHSDSKYLGKATNNVAEYYGVIIALEYLVGSGLNTNVIFNMDSELVVKQLNGAYKIKDKSLLELAMKAKKIIADNKLQIQFVHIPREKNAFTDNLVNEKLDESSRI